MGHTHGMIGVSPLNMDMDDFPGTLPGQFDGGVVILEIEGLKADVQLKVRMLLKEGKSGLRWIEEGFGMDLDTDAETGGLRPFLEDCQALCQDRPILCGEFSGGDTAGEYFEPAGTEHPGFGNDILPLRHFLLSLITVEVKLGVEADDGGREFEGGHFFAECLDLAEFKGEEVIGPDLDTAKSCLTNGRE